MGKVQENGHSEVFEDHSFEYLYKKLDQINWKQVSGIDQAISRMIESLGGVEKIQRIFPTKRSLIYAFEGIDAELLLVTKMHNVRKVLHVTNNTVNAIRSSITENISGGLMEIEQEINSELIRCLLTNFVNCVFADTTRFASGDDDDDVIGINH